jgi:phosphoserine phosphatase RsbX
MEKVKSQLIEWGVAGRALAGQGESGDMHLVTVLPQEALVAVVDGLGHGEEAAAAAKIAVKTLQSFAGDSLITLVDHCHGALRHTRGAVMSLAAFHELDSVMSWLGVGNVEGFLWHRDAQKFPEREGLLLRGGVVGDHLPRLAASILQISEGDLLILATDGIRPGFAENINPNDPPQQIADRILAQHGLVSDDALVLVVRYIHGQDRTSFR